MHNLFLFHGPIRDNLQVNILSTSYEDQNLNIIIRHVSSSGLLIRGGHSNLGFWKPNDIFGAKIVDPFFVLIKINFVVQYYNNSDQ